ncbi:hypothetical protein CVN76_12305 [Bacillus sp. mrc49]|nr:hypothetical protein CVN76_12305 [Bacillus sp. mrc49]
MKGKNRRGEEILEESIRRIHFVGSIIFYSFIILFLVILHSSILFGLCPPSVLVLIYSYLNRLVLLGQQLLQTGMIVSLNYDDWNIERDRIG